MADSAEYNSIEKQIDLIGKDKTSVTLQTKYVSLAPLEKYINEKVAGLEIDLSFDVTAHEAPFFQTINYTTYAGFLILHPLSPEQALRQMHDAYADNCETKNHVQYLRDKINTEQNFSKYDNTKWDSAEFDDVEACVVLSGGNKLKKHSCLGMLQRICDRHGAENVVMKKHPISHNEAYEELETALQRNCWFAEGNEDLFHIIKTSKYVYTTMLSETALIANIMGKKVHHYDLLQNRETAPFYHINYFIFSRTDPLEWADRAFASPKSGVIHPDVDENWKDKIDKYFDYILELRALYKDAYIWG